jgi:hypothetical protein
VNCHACRVAESVGRGQLTCCPTSPTCTVSVREVLNPIFRAHVPAEHLNVDLLFSGVIVGCNEQNWLVTARACPSREAGVTLCDCPMGVAEGGLDTV